MFNINLREVTGTDVVREFQSYGLSVVGVDPTLHRVGAEIAPYQTFVDLHLLGADTPFVYVGGLINDSLPDDDDNDYFKSLDRLLATGWRYFPGEPVSPKQLSDLVLTRLIEGSPVTLVRQTATIVRDLARQPAQHSKLSMVQRTGLRVAAFEVLLTGRPLLVAVRMASPSRQMPITWRSAAHLLVRLNRKRLTWHLADA